MFGWPTLKNMKRAWFERLRKGRLTRILQDLDNYLTNVEIRRGPPEGSPRVLVLSPHPDDESIGCGGTLALLSRAGADIDVAYMTSGAPAGDERTAAIREAEARRAAELLGVMSLRFLGGQEGDLHLQRWLVDTVAELLAGRSYHVVFCPWPHDGHSDHAATFRILKDALRRSGRAPQIWLYEVWAPLMANHVVDIDAVIAVKCDAIRAHESQVSGIDYTEKFLSLSRYRSLICRPARHAEAFLVCSPDVLENVGPGRAA